MEREQVRGINQGGGKLVLSASILTDSHREETVVPNLVLRSPGLHTNVRTPGPGASGGQAAVSIQLFGAAVDILGEQLVAQDSTTR